MATTTKKTATKVAESPVVEEVQDVQSTETQEVENNENSTSYSDIIKNLLANGAKRIKDVRVKNVKITEQENYTRVALTLDRKVKGYLANEDGEYEESETNIIFTSVFALVGMMRENEELSFIGNRIIDRPIILEALLSGAKIDVIQQHIVAGDAYVNPFSSSKEEQFFDHNLYINNVTSVTLGKQGEKLVEKLLDKYVDFD